MKACGAGSIVGLWFFALCAGVAIAAGPSQGPVGARQSADAPRGLFYKARTTGNMWDTWLYCHKGTYYLYYLCRGQQHWDAFAVATSPDGAYWKEHGYILKKDADVKWMGTGSTWKSPNFLQDGKFQTNFSWWIGPRQTIFFAESKDLLRWTPVGRQSEFVQDERWYERNGRWDCIWTIARPGGGLYGYWTATPKAATGGRFGFGQSADGVKWEALAPPKVEGVGEGEVGAIERIGDRFYMLFGTGRKMVALVADKPEGPFRTTAKNPVVLSGNTYFARFLPAPDGLLANHHTIAADGQVSFAPLKSATVDADGTLRLGWWKGNEKLKRQPLQLDPPDTAAGPAPAMVRTQFDAKGGLVLEGTLAVPARGDSKSAGLYIEFAPQRGMAVLVGPGGVTRFGPVQGDGSDLKVENQVDRELNFGPTSRFRLLLRDSLFEFYLDDHLIQCWRAPTAATGRIGLFGETGKDLRAWRTEM